MKSQLRIYWPEKPKELSHLSLIEGWLQALGDKYELVWTNENPHIIIFPIPAQLERKLAIISKAIISKNTSLCKSLNKRLRMLNIWIQLTNHIEEQIKYCKNADFYRPLTVAIFKNTTETDINSLISGFNYCFFLHGQLTETEKIRRWHQIANDAISKYGQFSRQSFFLKFLSALQLHLKRAVISVLQNLRFFWKKMRFGKWQRELLYLSLYEILYPFVHHRFAYPPHYEKYRVDLNRLHLIKRTPGISAMLRVYNEEFLLQTCVESQIKFF